MTINGTISGRFDWCRECIGAIEFITNGPQGGDAGHGGFLEVKFKNEGSTCMEAVIDGRESTVTEYMTLRFRGDAELEIALECFEFLAVKLRAVRQLSGSDISPAQSD